MKSFFPSSIADWLQGVLLLLLLPLLNQGVLLLSPESQQSFVFWPVVAFAIAILRFRPQLFLFLPCAQMLWWAISGLPVAMLPLLLLNFLGPLLYQLLSLRLSAPLNKWLPARASELLLLLLLCALPNAIVGGWWLPSPEPYGAMDVAAIWLVGELATLVMLLPLLQQLYRPGKLPKFDPGPLLILGFFLLLPLLVSAIAASYARAIQFLLVPVVVILTLKYDRFSLRLTLLLAAVVQLLYARYALGGYEQGLDLITLALVTLVLMSAFIAIEFLLDTVEERNREKNLSDWQVKHDTRSGCLNEQGLVNWYEQHNHQQQPLAIMAIRPRQRQTLIDSLSWQQLTNLEANWLRYLRATKPLQIAKISDLAFVLVFAQSQPLQPVMQSLQRLQIRLPELHLTLFNLMTGVQSTSRTDLRTILGQLNFLLGRFDLSSHHPWRILPDMTQAVDREKSLRQFEYFRALAEQGGLRLAIQPIAEVQSGRWTKAEVLIRIADDDLLHYPGSFLPLFQDFEFLPQLDLLVTRLVFQSWLQIQADYPDLQRLAINITGVSLCDDQFAQEFMSLLRRHPINSTQLTVEITETDAIKDLLVAQQNLKMLVAAGIQLAVDDFGTGLATLSYLDDFPLSCLKVDGRFVSDVLSNRQHQAMLSSVVMLARSYDLYTVAECVEDQDCIELLRQLGIDFVQGYGIAKPKLLGS